VVEFVSVTVECDQGQDTPQPVLTLLAKDGREVAVARLEWEHCDELTGLLLNAAQRFAS
jgi:hypothetical protein